MNQKMTPERAKQLRELSQLIGDYQAIQKSGKPMTNERLKEMSRRLAKINSETSPPAQSNQEPLGR